jgi:hypothetical protein
VSHLLHAARNEYRHVLQPYQGGPLNKRESARRVARLLHGVPESNPILGTAGNDDPTPHTTVALAEFGIAITVDGNLLRATPIPRSLRPSITDRAPIDKLEHAA